MQALADIAANEFDNKVEIAIGENIAGTIVNRSGSMADEEIYRLLEVSLVLTIQRSAEATASVSVKCVVYYIVKGSNTSVWYITV